MQKIFLKIKATVFVISLCIFALSPFSAFAVQETLSPVSKDSELAILFLQVQVGQLRSQVQQTLNPEELEASLESLKIKGEEAFGILEEIQNQKVNADSHEKDIWTTKESRTNKLIASIISGFRFVLNREAQLAAQIKSARLMLELNQRLEKNIQFYAEQSKNQNLGVRYEAILHLQELMPTLVVLDPLAKNLRDKNSELRENAVKNLALFNRILSLFQEAYSFVPQHTDSSNSEKSKHKLDIFSPYLAASRPGLKQALFSKEVPSHHSASSVLAQMETLNSRSTADLS